MITICRSGKTCHGEWPYVNSRFIVFARNRPKSTAAKKLVAPEYCVDCQNLTEKSTKWPSEMAKKLSLVTFLPFFVLKSQKKFPREESLPILSHQLPAPLNHA
jgi:hypothetical protein